MDIKEDIDILVPTFHLWQPGDKTLEQRFAETVELRKQLVENMKKDWEETRKMELQEMLFGS